MSEENARIVREMFEAFRRGEYEVAVQAFDPAVEGDFTHVMDGRMTRGPEELWAEVARWFSGWRQLHTDVEEIEHAGDRVFTVLTQRGVGRRSGIETELRYAQVYTLDGGRIVAMKTYLDVDEGRAAAGVPDGGSG